MSASLEQPLDDALAAYAADPQSADLLLRICRTLCGLRRDDELLPWAEQGLALDPRNPWFVHYRARALRLAGRHHDAVATWLAYRALPWKPQFYQLKLGRDLYLAGDVERAIPLLESAMRTGHAEGDPVGARAENWLAEALLSIGQTQGFLHWLIRNTDDSGNYRPADLPTWSGGQDVRGRRVLVTHQLGFGDQFLLFACIAHWRAAGATLMITCDRQIHALVEASLPDCVVVAAPRPLPYGAPLPDALLPAVRAFAPDLHASLLHLPVLAAAHDPLPERYFPAWLRAPETQRDTASGWAAALRAQHPGKAIVGLFWDCGQRHVGQLGSVNRCWAALRSLPLAEVDRLTMDPRIAGAVHFVNLHHPSVEAEAGHRAGNVSRYEPGIQTFAETAACIEQLDAVLSVDSGIANLAAMIGRPTAVMTNATGEWRWGHDDPVSPWMHDVSVLRQSVMGDWSTVRDDAVAWLAEFAKRAGR